MDSVKDLLKVKGDAVISVNPDATVLNTAQVMAEKRIGAILILNGETPVGIFSERDFLIRVVLKGLDPSIIQVSKVMSDNLIVITPENTIKEAMAIMTEKRCRHLPVIENGKLCGMVSIGDCTKWISRDQDFSIKHLTDYIKGRYPN